MRLRHGGAEAHAEVKKASLLSVLYVQEVSVGISGAQTMSFLPVEFQV